MKINGWSRNLASAYVDEQFIIFNKRCEGEWSLDLSRLELYGFTEEEVKVFEQKSVGQRSEGRRVREK